MVDRGKSTPNRLLVEARRRRLSPSGSGRPMSRQELAEAVNTYLADRYSAITSLDENDIGKLERGEYRWPREQRREALRAVLHAQSDQDLGFYIVRGPRTAPIDEHRNERSPDASQAVAARLQEIGSGAVENKTDVGLVRRAGAAWFGMLPDDLLDLPGPWSTQMEAPPKIEQAHVEALRRSTVLFEQWDHQYGGGLARAAMSGQLEWVCRAARTSIMSGATRRSWQASAARLGDLAGWACFDAGDAPQLVERFFLKAIQLAGEADDVQQRTHTATSMSRHLTYLGRTDEALEMSSLARLGWRHLPPLGRAVIGIVEARAYGKIGNTAACREAVELCDHHFATSAPDGPHDETWGYYADEGQILGDAGHGLFDLALRSDDHIQAEITIGRLEAAYALHPADVVRSRALTMIRIASLKARHRDIDEALAAAEIAVAEAGQLQSHRVTDDLRLLSRILGRAVTSRGDQERVETVRTDIATLVNTSA
ncbi:hypothetical protein [Actinoplanes sp. NPDC049316]|uniref:hypothetical protein n=1 Tax=Actinoplanes sp. NPDC049316 TaxID=3154727 RepID=UPI00342CFD06